MNDDPNPSTAAAPARDLGDGLRRALSATVWRVRAQRALDAGAVFLLVGLGLAAVVVTAMKTGALPEPRAIRFLLAAGALPPLAALASALRRVPAALAAKLLDRAHSLQDRVSNAVEFSDAAHPSQFMLAAIDDARTHAGALSPRDAMPLQPPRSMLGVAALSLGVAGLGALEVPHTWVERVVHDGIMPVFVHEDDLDSYAHRAQTILQDSETDADVRAAAQEFNRIIEDLADERLDREESLRRIAELQRQLAETRPAEDELLNDSLRELGEDLRRSRLADELSRALRESDAERAQAEMRRLAERLRQERPNRQDRAALQRALERAAQRRADDQTSEIERRERQLQRLLQRRQEQQRADTPAQRRLLQRRRRELDRLRREHAQAQARQRQLERLRRELNRGARSLQRDRPSEASDSLERGAEDLNRMARQQLSEEQRRQLEQQLRQLREAIRRARQQAQQAQQGQRGQGGQGGQGQGRMDRFVLRARGEGDGDGVPIGVPGQGGQRGARPGRGQGQGGQGQDANGEERQRMLVMGGGGEPTATLEIPGMGGAQPSRGGQGQGPSQPGPGAGTGHDETTLEDPSRAAGTRRTVRVEGEQGQGPSRSEVIRVSGQHGFASRGYEQTYPEYRGHAEEVLERDDVPPGRRFYVRRYFQLIRPRR